LPVDQRGPTAFDFRAIFQKRDNLRSIFKKIMLHETTDSQDLKLKQRK